LEVEAGNIRCPTPLKKGILQPVPNGAKQKSVYEKRNMGKESLGHYE